MTKIVPLEIRASDKLEMLKKSLENAYGIIQEIENIPPGWLNSAAPELNKLMIVERESKELIYVIEKYIKSLDQSIERAHGKFRRSNALCQSETPEAGKK